MSAVITAVASRPHHPLWDAVVVLALGIPWVTAAVLLGPQPSRRWLRISRWSFQHPWISTSIYTGLWLVWFLAMLRTDGVLTRVWIGIATAIAVVLVPANALTKKRRAVRYFPPRPDIA